MLNRADTLVKADINYRNWIEATRCDATRNNALVYRGNCCIGRILRCVIELNRIVKCSCIYAYVGMYAYTCTRTRIRKSRKNVIKYVIHAYYFKLSIECPNIKYIIARLNRVFSLMLSIYIYLFPYLFNSIRSLIKNDTCSSQMRLIFIITNWYKRGKFDGRKK